MTEGFDCGVELIELLLDVMLEVVVVMGGSFLSSLILFCSNSMNS